MDRDKRQLRRLKRDVKRAGQRKRRQQLKRDLRENPEEAHWSEPTFGHASSETMNGLDRDATRRPKET